MPDLRPNASVGIKLASLAVHADEFLSSDGHSDPEVQAYMELLRPFALLPEKR